MGCEACEGVNARKKRTANERERKSPHGPLARSHYVQSPTIRSPITGPWFFTHTSHSGWAGHLSRFGSSPSPKPTQVHAFMGSWVHVFSCHQPCRLFLYT
jgi:hypothetical protein